MNTRLREINNQLRCIGRIRKQICEQAMAELQIQPSQHFVLVCLKRMGRAASQSQLAEMMQVSPASVARSLKNLDRDGYITRSDGADGRCNEIVITEKGLEELAQSMMCFQALDDRCYEGFTEAELDQLQLLLSKLLNKLNEVKNEKEMKA